MTSTKPYLLRAIYEWAEDNGFTPQVLVDAEFDGVDVPQEHVVDGQIILNIGAAAVRMDMMDNEFVCFSARFSGKERNIVLPIESIKAIFARENSQGIFFEESDGMPDPDKPSGSKANKPKVVETNSDSAKPAQRVTKKNNSHLKIVK